MNAELYHRLVTEIKRVLPQVRELRRKLHQHPELRFQEWRTRETVDRLLRENGLTPNPPLMETDLVAEISRPGGPLIGLRADMDALPIAEQTGLPYASVNKGIMHACGHDGHTAILTGAAMVLSRLADALPVGVRFIFQPAEEVECGGEILVNRGVCDGLSAVYALHGWPDMPLNTLSSRVGALFAAADFFQIRVHGHGGHGAIPEKACNPIPAAARILDQLDQLHQRRNREKGEVITACSVHAGNGSNVIPDTVTIEGTIRYLEAGESRAIQEDLEQILQQAETQNGLHTELEHQRKYRLPVRNQAAAVAQLRAIVAETPDLSWQEAEKPSMTAEDFAFFLDRCPGAMFWLGLGEKIPRLHTAKFDFPDDALFPGMSVLCQLALTHQG